MRSDELYKFCDGTLTSVRTVLHDIASNLRMEYLPQIRWSNLDRNRSCILIKAIGKLQLKRRLMRSLEKFVGGRDYGTDLRLLEQTIRLCHILSFHILGTSDVPITRNLVQGVLGGFKHVLNTLLLQSSPVKGALSSRLKMRTSPKVPSNFSNRYVALLQPLGFTIHNFHWLFNEVELVMNVVEIETDIQEKEQKENQRQTNPSTEWKGQSQKSSK
ncbi:hypothetical protein Tco_1104409 [Tanacetum coccineum]